MKIFTLVTILTIWMAGVIANGEGECIDLANHYDTPFRLWNKTMGVGIKMTSQTWPSGWWITYG